MDTAIRKSFLRINELAEILNLGRTATYQLVRSGKIPTVRIGGAIRIPVEALERWIAEQNGNTTGSRAAVSKKAPLGSTAPTANPSPCRGRIDVNSDSTTG